MQRRQFIAGLGSAAAWPMGAQQPNGCATALLLRTLQPRADSTADRIGQIIHVVISQIGWTVQLSWAEGTCEAGAYRRDRRSKTFLAQFDKVNVGLGRSGRLPCACQFFRFC
jgi:hypothetical protein